MTVGEPNSRELCLLVRVGRQLCALRLAHVEETMRPQPVRPFAGVPEFVRGLAIIRGDAVPVVDAALALFPDDGAPSPSRFVALRAANRRLALAVDQVLGVRDIDASQLSELPPLLSGAPEHAVSAMGTLDRQLLMILRSGRLVPNEVWAALDAGAAR